MGNPEDWARSLGLEIDAKKRAFQEEHANVNMQRDIIAEKMPQRWEDVITELQKHSIAYNEQANPERALVPSRLGSHYFSIKPEAQTDIVVAQYDPVTKQIHITTPLGLETLVPKVLLPNSGEVELVSIITGRATTPAEIAQTSLRKGLLKR